MPQTGPPMTTPTGSGGVSAPPPLPSSLSPQLASALPPSQKCAIVECPKPRYVDESGTVHECCGITHAMEHQRRLALMQRKLMTFTRCVQTSFLSKLYQVIFLGQKQEI